MKTGEPQRHAVSKEEDDSDCTSNCVQSIYIVIGVKIIKLVGSKPLYYIIRRVIYVYLCVSIRVRVCECV